jgi:hypothetical protein
MATRLMRLFVCAALMLSTVQVAAAQEDPADPATTEVIEQAPEATDDAPVDVPAEAPATESAPAAPATAGASVTFSKPLITPYPSFGNLLPSSESLAAKSLPAAHVLPSIAADDACSPASNPGTSDPNAPAATPGPLPKGMMMVLMTNTSDQVQSYEVKATRISSGTEITETIAPWIPAGKATIPMFVLMDDLPAVDDVAFTATLFDMPTSPCIDTSGLTANISFGQPTLSNLNVQIPVTNNDAVAYSLTLEAGLLQGDQLVAVGMGAGNVAANGTATGTAMLSFPFGLRSAPDHTSIVPALAPLGIRKAS